MKAIENKYRERDYEVKIRFPEFTCLCPMTSQPDFAEIVINYVPNKLLIELKSLKFYLNSFRDKGIFHEEAVNKISLHSFTEVAIGFSTRMCLPAFSIFIAASVWAKSGVAMETISTLLSSAIASRSVV